MHLPADSCSDGQPLPLPRVGRGLLHFNDDFERDYYLAHCRRQREEALARWERESDFVNVGEVGFWTRELARVGAPLHGAKTSLCGPAA
jgi:hypothetical protein